MEKMTNGGRVLIVDDDPAIRETISLALAFSGWRIETAGGADEAMAVLDRQWPDVLLLDLLLGEGSMTGEALHQQILSRFGVVPPTVFLSGLPGGERRVPLLSGNGTSFLSKPSSIEALEQAVSAAAEWGRLHPERSRLGPASRVKAV